jgi:hypothetical protein
VSAVSVHYLHCHYYYHLTSLAVNAAHPQPTKNTMKVCIICVGSRGDAEPFCALSAKLIDQGHSVEFFCQPELQSFIPKSTSTDGTVTVTVTVHSLPFTQFDFYKYAGSPSKGTDHPNVRVRFVGAVADIIAELVLPCYEQVLPVAKTCQVMVTSALARNLCFALTEQLSIPTVLVHLQSLVPTKLYPHASNAEDCLASLDKFWSHASLTEEEASKNEESYWFLEQFQHEFVQDALNDLYSKLQIPPLTWDENRKILSGHHPQIYLANSFYDELIPATPKALTDVGPQLHYVGALADHYIPGNFIPNAQLQSFLDQENTKKTICIGYGSMPYSQVSLLLEVVHQLKRRTVLVGKALELPKMMADKNNNDESDDKGASLDLDWIQTNVFQIDSAPYAWLLPQCSMML